MTTLTLEKLYVPVTAWIIENHRRLNAGTTGMLPLSSMKFRVWNPVKPTNYFALAPVYAIRTGPSKESTFKSSFKYPGPVYVMVLHSKQNQKVVIQQY